MPGQIVAVLYTAQKYGGHSLVLIPLCITQVVSVDECPKPNPTVQEPECQIWLDVPAYSPNVQRPFMWLIRGLMAEDRLLERDLYPAW